MAVNTAKIDLHLHLDGSLPTALAYEMAGERGLLPQGARDYRSFEEAVKIPRDNGSLYEFLNHFALPLSILQDGEAMERAVAGLLDQLASQGILYAEIRFAPQLHTRRGMTQRQGVEAALRGLQEGRRQNPGIQAGLILCAMVLSDPAQNHRENLETVRLAHQFLGQGVVAMDLAGAEGLAPMEAFADLFANARSLELPFTIHAGESAGPENVAAALSFGPRRIGHGLTAIQDLQVVERLREEGVTLEMCPTSNLQCKLIPSIQEHPIHRLMELGVQVTVNTDNRSISDIDLPHEHWLLQQELSFTVDELWELERSAARAAFLSGGEKAALLEELNCCANCARSAI